MHFAEVFVELVARMFLAQAVGAYRRGASYQYNSNTMATQWLLPSHLHMMEKKKKKKQFYMGNTVFFIYSQGAGVC